MVKVVFFFLFLASVLLPINASGSDTFAGTPFQFYAGFKDIKNYTPEIYNSLEQNWCILQDKRGLIYVANQGGLLEYDGLSWRRIAVNHDAVRSIAMTGNGIIYIGGRSEIGRLEPDSNGELHYISLINLFEKNQVNFSDVYQVFCAGDRVWFRTANMLLGLYKEKIDCCEPGEFKAMFKWNGRFFAQKKGAGLMHVVDKTFTPAPGGQIFADKTISLASPYGKNGEKLLIGTWRHGFFLYDGMNAVPFATGIDEFVRERFYCGTLLSNGDYAIGTSGGGLAIMNSSGKLLRIFNKSAGLKDNNVKYIFEDFSGNLWLALNNSIAKIDYASAISFFDDRSGLDGLVLSVITYKNRLYAGTSSGLYCLESTSPGINAVFKPFPNITGYCRCLLATGDSLLAATAPNGIFQLEDTSLPRVISPIGAYVLAASHLFPGRIWVSDAEGIKILYRQKDKNGRWQIEPGFLIKNLGI
ncbi:MAG: hypothetical protein MUF15_08190, partial [Acidobacteria bacterium]|nr:hypothetical protein [Acidobacteriota bacterium]